MRHCIYDKQDILTLEGKMPRATYCQRL